MDRYLLRSIIGAANAMAPIETIAERCPVAMDELMDAYWLGRLPAKQRRSLERHCSVCVRCSAALAETGVFIASIRRARGLPALVRVKR